VHRQTPQKLPFVLDGRLARDLKNIYLRTDLGVIDCGGRSAVEGRLPALFRVVNLNDRRMKESI
jgi:hypothetical protein